jgi:dTDP-4-dehydrorhamnose 3,5-epimerase
MKFTPLFIPGAWMIELEPRADHRGYFMRCYDEALFREQGLQTTWLQENQSLSRAPYTLRGLHFQHPPATETKLVRAVAGRLFDVMVDLRVNSPAYGKWFGAELSADNHTMLYIPKGCAHGFLTLAPDTIISYKVDAMYAANLEGQLRFDDANVGIAWPLPADVMPTISDKDMQAKMLRELQLPFRLVG